MLYIKPASGCQTVRSRASRLASRGVLVVASSGARTISAGTQEANGSDEATRRRQLLLMAAAAVPLTTASQAVAAESCAPDKTSASGIQWCDVREGSGATPARGAVIRCHYTGRLASNNAVFDSSYERGRPLSFKIGVREVIAGWDEGILGGEGIAPMKEGGLRRLVIPPELAYGSRGAGGVIPPNATLIFDVELLAKR